MQQTLFGVRRPGRPPDSKRAVPLLKTRLTSLSVPALRHSALGSDTKTSADSPDGQLRIVFVSSEVAPWSKVGGLADVLAALPKALAARGHRVMTVAPRYAAYDDVEPTGVHVPLELPPGLALPPALQQAQEQEQEEPAIEDSARQATSEGGGAQGPDGRGGEGQEAAAGGGGASPRPSEDAGCVPQSEGSPRRRGRRRKAATAAASSELVACSAEAAPGAAAEAGGCGGREGHSAAQRLGEEQQEQGQMGGAIQPHAEYHLCRDAGVDRVFVDHPLFLGAGLYGGPPAGSGAATGVYTYTHLDPAYHPALELQYNVLCQAALAAPLLLWDSACGGSSSGGGRLAPVEGAAAGGDVVDRAGEGLQPPAAAGPLVFCANDWPTALLPLRLHHCLRPLSRSLSGHSSDSSSGGLAPSVAQQQGEAEAWACLALDPTSMQGPEGAARAVQQLYRHLLPYLQAATAAYCIHNLAYQGVMPALGLPFLSLPSAAASGLCNGEGWRGALWHAEERRGAWRAGGSEGGCEVRWAPGGGPAADTGREPRASSGADVRTDTGAVAEAGTQHTEAGTQHAQQEQAGAAEAAAAGGQPGGAKQRRWRWKRKLREQEAPPPPSSEQQQQQQQQQQQEDRQQQAQQGVGGPGSGREQQQQQQQDGQQQAQQGSGREQPGEGGEEQPEGCQPSALGCCSEAAAVVAAAAAAACPSGKLNLKQGALLTTDALVTVSPGYALEVQHDPGMGCGMQDLIAARGITGIMNGIDTAEWDPASDPRLPTAARYTAATASAGKARAKMLLQERLGLRVDPQAPMVGFVGRLTEQKGVDVLLGAAPALLAAPAPPGPRAWPSPARRSTPAAAAGSGAAAGGGEEPTPTLAGAAAQEAVVESVGMAAAQQQAQQGDSSGGGGTLEAAESGECSAQAIQLLSCAGGREDVGGTATLVPAPADITHAVSPACLTVPPTAEASAMAPAAAAAAAAVPEQGGDVANLPVADCIADAAGSGSGGCSRDSWAGAQEAQQQAVAGVACAAEEGLKGSSPMQLVILGTGEHWMEQALSGLEKSFPGQAMGVTQFSEELAHWIVAASDYLLVPSRFEPCGLVAQCAARYGAVPIVTAVGGLKDLVTPEVGYTIRPFGFDTVASSQRQNVQELVKAVQAAVQEYGTERYRSRQQACMALDVSWDKPAREWEALFWSMAGGRSAAAGAAEGREGGCSP